MRCDLTIDVVKRELSLIDFHWVCELVEIIQLERSIKHMKTMEDSFVMCFWKKCCEGGIVKNRFQLGIHA